MTGGPPPMWAPDPERPGMVRYWDGKKWTEHRTPDPTLRRSPLPAPTVRATSSEPESKDFLVRVGDQLRRIPKAGWIMLAIGAFVAYVAIHAAVSDDEAPSADDLEYSAFDVCKDFVSDRLRSPGSAVFRNFFEDDGEVTVTGSGDGPYTVRSTVDADNGFGASIRSNFVCVVNRVDEDRWRLADISITER